MDNLNIRWKNTEKIWINYLPFEHCTISLKHWLMHAESSASQFVMHSNEFSSHRSVQARFKSGTLKIFARFRWEKRQKNLQALREWIKVFGPATNQDQWLNQKWESHFCNFWNMEWFNEDTIFDFPMFPLRNALLRIMKIKQSIVTTKQFKHWSHMIHMIWAVSYGPYVALNSWKWRYNRLFHQYDSLLYESYYMTFRVGSNEDG